MVGDPGLHDLLCPIGEALYDLEDHKELSGEGVPDHRVAVVRHLLSLQLGQQQAHADPALRKVVLINHNQRV